MPTVLINPETSKAEAFEPDQAQQALQSGYHVPLTDTEGNAFAAPFEEAQRLVGEGSHFQPTEGQLGELLKHAEFTTPGQQAATFIEGALRPLSFGLSGPTETGLGISTNERQLERARQNPGISAMGEMAGIAGGIFAAPESSVPGLITKAGDAAAKQIAARGMFGRAAQMAVRGAIETGLYEASNQASEKLLGDPNATAEHMMSHIGFSSLLGGGLGLAMAPIAEGISKAVGLGQGYLGRTIEKGSDIVEKPSTLEEILPYTGTSQAERADVIKGLSELKPNVKEIDEAGARLGVTPLESQRSNSKIVQNLDSALMKEKTWTGMSRQTEAAQQFKVVSNAVDEALGNDLGLTKAEVGETLKSGLATALEQEYKPIQNIYRGLKEAGQNVPIEANAIKSAAKDMTNIEGLMSSKGLPISESSPGYQLAKRVSEELPNLGTIDDLRLYSQRIGQDTMAKPELKYVAGQIQKKLSALEESTLLAKAKDQPLMASLIDEHMTAKSSYSALRDKLDELGSVIGKKLRKGEGPQAFVDWLSATAPERIADKLFTKNNSKFLSFFREQFPEQADLLSLLKKNQIRDAAMRDGVIQPSKVLKEIDKLEPEIKNFLFKTEDLQRLKDAKTLIESFPKEINPSGTAETIHIFDLFKNLLSLPAAQAASYLKKAMIKGLVNASPGEAPLITTLLHLNDFSSKAMRTMNRYGASIFGAGAVKYHDESTKKGGEALKANEPLPQNKIATIVAQNSQNPMGLVDHLSTNFASVSPYAPETISAVSKGVGRAVSFLASKVPKSERQAPLDEKGVISNSEIAKFNRYASVVENPMSVLGHVKDGTVVPQDMETLGAVYPTMLNQMRHTVTEKLINFASKHDVAELPYKTKLGLSMFLGQNLDSTISPQAISSNQAALSVTAMQNAAQQQSQKQAKPSKAGMRQMKFIANDQTKAQQSLNRVRG